MALAWPSTELRTVSLLNICCGHSNFQFIQGRLSFRVVYSSSEASLASLKYAYASAASFGITFPWLYD